MSIQTEQVWTDPTEEGTLFRMSKSTQDITVTSPRRLWGGLVSNEVRTTRNR